MFTAPGFAVFTDLLAGWVLTPGRRTITRMITVARTTPTTGSSGPGHGA